MRAARWCVVLAVGAARAAEKLDSNQVEQRKLALADLPCRETEGKHTCGSAVPAPGHTRGSPTRAPSS